MPKFGRTSKKRLATVHPLLQLLLNVFIKYYDCTIVCGHRNKPNQNKAFKEGVSTKEWPKSKHNFTLKKKPYSLAVDIAPWIKGRRKIDWKDKRQFYYMLGQIKILATMLGIDIIVGADWNNNNDVSDQKLDDLVHIELVSDIIDLDQIRETITTALKMINMEWFSYSKGGSQ